MLHIPSNSLELASNLKSKKEIEMRKELALRVKTMTSSQKNRFIVELWLQRETHLKKLREEICKTKTSLSENQ